MTVSFGNPPLGAARPPTGLPALPRAGLHALHHPGRRPRRGAPGMTSYLSIVDGQALLCTPHVQVWCERHDGPAVTRAEDAVCCEHHDTEDGVPGYCCWCGAEGEWPA